ncbi:biotin synthase BioB [Desulfobotulus sp. H1]|uniref:Biotin synthase n=1 Tax=Desulfobotulus pelophilus TaxID=2823377 RepID=A0ABT3N4U4_9BACT|nr:biotin synthase BioB [Desulfobotulus pelophilus]MCW7752472.1 biotin synthase BioB [Desulfobotulus pelophilus]
MNPWKEAEKVVAGQKVEDSFFLAILKAEAADMAAILAGADRIRRTFFRDDVRLCAICNGKSGRCSEDCSFCSQSVHASCDIDVYPLMSQMELVRSARDASAWPLDRYSIVTSGRGMEEDELRLLLDALREFPQTGMAYCASLGILSERSLKCLKAAGISRYHHNLETAASLFPSVCSTHSYEERLQTVKAAKRAGLEICCGGIFGLGESDEQILEFARTLEGLNVDAVPMNFLVPIAGTATGHYEGLSPLRCLKILAAFRFKLPRTPLIVCGGRQQNFASLESFIFTAGATGLMTGDFLTTPGKAVERDLAMLADGGWRVVRADFNGIKKIYSGDR